ncbi:hypothetical protein ACFQ6E_38225 [Streptomyces sp. NPDC056462]
MTVPTGAAQDGLAGLVPRQAESGPYLIMRRTPHDTRPRTRRLT